MKIAIHEKSGKFSPFWIKYCQDNNIDYKLVDVFDNDIILQINDCDALMWHFAHQNYKDKLLAQPILFALESSGKKIFPNINTSWHYDDKIGQKYLLEAINAPLIRSYVFTSEVLAHRWVEESIFPKVFKLRGGAGATNVKLIKSKKQAHNIIKTSFRKGFRQVRWLEKLKSSVIQFRPNKVSTTTILRYLYYYVTGYTDILTKHVGKEIGYVYFQDFIANNNYDTRLIIINGNKAYGMQRLVRKGDFRASGSSQFKYDPVPKEILEIGFQVAKKLNLQSVAFDFVIDNGEPKIIELSYGFGTLGSSKCEGYWDDKYQWHHSKFNPFGWMIENLLHNK